MTLLPPPPARSPLRTLLAALALGVVHVVSTGCATLPAKPDAAAAVLDIDRIVHAEESTEWLIDDEEFADALPQALRTVCQLRDETATEARQWLSERIELLGGPARQQWEASHDLSGLKPVLRAERSLALFDRAVAQRERCPFWLEQTGDFRGMHGEADRFVLLIESGGRAMIQSGASAGISGGGSGRLLAGAGLGPRWTIAAGGEFGGGGLLPVAERPGAVEAYVVGAAPVLARLNGANTFLDFEAAPVMLRPLGGDDTFAGARIAVGAGLSTLRVRGFRPHFVVSLAFEQYLDDDAPITRSLSLASRVSLAWDP